MIKKFIAKLTSWNSGRNRVWEKEKISLQDNINRQHMNLERELAEERRRQHLRNVPEEERLRRLKEDVEATVERRDDHAA